MFERMDLIRVEPKRVLDVGCGTGDGTRALAVRFPQAHTVGVDLSARRVAAAAAAMPRRLPQWVADSAHRLRAAIPRAAGVLPTPSPSVDLVVGDAHALPLPEASVDLVWSNLALHWFDDPRQAIAEWHRIARPHGLLMFSAFGVDTLRELRAARLPTMPFHDMHDLGDALAGAGFAEPVMDMETLHLTYEDASALLADLRALGGDARRDRRRGLSTPRARDRLAAALRADSQAGGARLSLTFEIVYGHAWLGERKRRDDGYAPIEWRPRERIARGGAA